MDTSNLKVYSCSDCYNPATNRLTKGEHEVYCCDVHTQDRFDWNIQEQFIVKLKNKNINLPSAVDTLRGLIGKHARVEYKGLKVQAILTNFDINKWAYFGTITHDINGKMKGDWILAPVNKIIKLES